MICVYTAQASLIKKLWADDALSKSDVASRLDIVTFAEVQGGEYDCGILATTRSEATPFTANAKWVYT
jgi:hypothetical protein